MTTDVRNIVFLDRETLPPSVDVRRPAFPHDWTDHARTAAEDVAARARDAHIIITNKVPVRGDALKQCPNVQMIAVSATGTDNVDLDYCRDHGITVSNIRGYAKATVPEHTFALILALSHSIVPYHQSVAAGRWQNASQFCYLDYPMFDLYGKTLGIIGGGVLGKAVAKIADGFGLNVLFAGRKGADAAPGYTPSDTVLAESDIITLHCPLNAATENLIGAPEFAAMRKKPILINTSRGGLVDEAALGPALDAGQIAGAAFDVVSSEPIDAEHPFLALMARPNFILTPHVAWASREAIQSLADQLMDNIDAFVAGAPRNVVGG